MATSRTERLAIPDLAIKGAVVRARLEDLMERAGAPAGPAVPRNAGTLLDAAVDAAYGRSPSTRRLRNWWSGTLNDIGYRSLHAASAELAALYSPEEVRAAIPDAVGRIAGSGLSGSDARRLAAQQALAQPDGVDAVRLRHLIAIGYDVADEAYARLRSFRNVVLLAALLVTVVGGAFVAYAASHPDVVPLCFNTVRGTTKTVICPTSETAASSGHATTQDVLVVCLLGLLGATLSAAVSLRNVRGSAEPYSIAVALTVLKVPTGAITAIVALIAIQAGFVPGLSALDSSAQILAYALLFGYAQQVLTGLVDRQGASVLAGVPNRATAASVAATTMIATSTVAPSVDQAGTNVAEEAQVVSEEVPDELPDEQARNDQDDGTDEDDGTDDVSADDVDDSDVDDSDVPDLYQQDVPHGTIEDAVGTLEDLSDEDDGETDDAGDDAGDGAADGVPQAPSPAPRGPRR